MERRVFIVNPVSGKGKSLVIAKLLEEQCKQKHINYMLLYTRQKGDATRYVKNLTSPGDIIYSVGGDGTLNEIVNGVVGLERKICVVPAGSGNDFYKSLVGEDKTIDVGVVNDKYFINSFSIGIDADICENANLFRKDYIPSSMIYDLSILYTLMKYRSKNIFIDENNIDCTLMSITNGKYYGGGFKINPDAKLDDGVLDMIVVDKMSKPNLIYLLTKLLKGEHQNEKGINISKVKNVKIYSPVELLACYDGEMIKEKEYNIGILPKALSFYNDERLDIKKLLKK